MNQKAKHYMSLLGLHETRTQTKSLIKRLRTKAFWQPHYFIVFLSIAFFVVAAAMISTWYKYQLNPDATSYMSIAEKYASGDFRHALNGYWAPFFSWMLVPAAWLDLNLIVAAKGLLALAGSAILVLLYGFLYKKGTGRLLASLAALAAALLMLPWVTVESITPDLFMVLWTMVLIVLVDRFWVKPTVRLAVVLGCLGAVMYFTKGFGLFLFAGVIGVMALWQWRESRDFKSVFARYTPLGITFLILILPFIGLISIKYHKPTINNAGVYDHRIFGPVAKDAQPIEYAGPLIPPNDAAMSAWEDPTPLAYMVPDWNILGSKQNLKFFFESVLGRNVNRTINAIASFGPLIAFGVIALLWGCLQAGRYRREFLFMGLAGGMMTLGYLLVLTQARYLWTLAIIGLAAVGFWLTLAREKKVVTNRQIIAAAAVICSVMLLTTLQNVFAYKYIDRQFYNVANSLGGVILPKSKIISDNYNQSYYVCFYLKIQCFSVVAPPSENTQAYYAHLKQLGITHYIDYHTRDNDVTLQQFVSLYFTKVDTRVVDQVPVTTYTLN